ncbi:hypothetical protein DFJ58DRAFT_671542 [Suillus subalutaceus]|uniref:uncharacterized protein n=1 Tax=Suillus subalutaceus TaxID=48586 RepID=UPI001B87CE8F|nr:uncharacterized protein DFJ58DRAFT_671542 [Suillus subalutaceus]KAG1830726.1 hypothetical protein DFJ58DRAFT_671542 [Suillus subalutaceus]
MHSTGVFIHNVQWCHCPESSVHQQHLHLLKAQLFPASTTCPRTAFTFEVLDHFLIDALECKTSAMSFFQKLCRLTNNAFPDSVPVSHCICSVFYLLLTGDLMNRKQFGFEHDTEVKPGAGDLALFCVACPQPGINIPIHWQDNIIDKFPNSWLVMQRYVVDGNFTAQHMNMKQPHLDFTLSDGLGYMVTEADYKAHLSSAQESKEVCSISSSCSNHRAVNAANTNQSNLRATGVAATACAHHGCFVPHTVVDFQKGERHMNVDYSICSAISYHSHDIGTSLIIYDIGCQWCINFSERVNNCSGLSLPKKRKVLTAVGKFHLSAHKLPCFARFSLNFIEGAGQVDGEILETLWAPFNKISPTARSMSQYHRQEILDDHMRDSNWKKLVGIVKTLLKKYKCAVKGVNDTKITFDELTCSLDPQKIALWEKDEKIAMELRGEHLDIYQLKIDKGKFPSIPLSNLMTNSHIPDYEAPTMAEIRLKLTESETLEIGRPGSVSWIIQGINLEDSQDGLRSNIQRFPWNATATQKAGLQEKRLKLAARIIKFHETADQMTQGIELDSGTVHVDDSRFCQAEAEEQAWEVADEDDSELIDEEIPAEDMGIWMPSSVTHDYADIFSLTKLQEEELELRKGQANDCLENIRLALGQKAVIYRQHFRSANSVWTGTRSKQDAQRCSLKIEKLVRSYQRARLAMERLGVNINTLENIYQEILPERLTVNRDVTEENRFGQGSDKLAWFWRVNGAHRSQQDIWMNECE